MPDAHSEKTQGVLEMLFGTQTTPLTGNLFAEILILIGAIIIFFAALGMLRFPDFYTRLHSSTKLVTLGGLGIFGGTALALQTGESITRLLLVAAFYFLTAPIAAYVIARAGYLRGLPPHKEPTSVDEWGALGVADTEFTREGQ